MRYASFGLQVNFFFIFYCFICMLKLDLVSILSMNALHDPEDLEMAALEKTGPSDAICVVWPTGEFFFIFYCFICMLMLDLVSIVFMNALQDPEDLGMAALEKTGPNDAICVVWATSKFFFLYSIVFSVC